MKLLTMMLVPAAAVLLFAQADTTLQKAIRKETVEGNLKGAIELYQKAVGQAGKDRTTAAQALVRMADCYQKLGDAQSRNIYERVVHEYADQKDAVAAARAHLGGAASASVSSHRVWTAVNAGFSGQVSPDGRYVPYTNWGKGDLFVHDTVSGTERRLTNTATNDEYSEEAAFSRDNKQLAYTWDTPQGVEMRVINIQLDGIPQPRRLVVNRDLKWISPYSWSPDGKTIAVRIQRQDNTGQLGLVSVADGSLRVLKSVDWRLGTGIFYSPDGKYLAYDNPAGDPTGQRDIFVLTADGSREIPAVVHPADDSVVGWSPDGTHLLFASNRSGSIALWALRFADGKPRGQPVFLKGDLGNSGLSTDGGFLGLTASGALYAEVLNPGADPSDIQLGPFDFTAGRFLSAPTSAAHAFLGTNILPAWSPDGKYLAFASMRKTHVAIEIRSMETGQIRELVPSPNFTPKAVSFRSLAWAPDGKSLIAAADGDKHGPGIFRIDAQTGDSSLIASPYATSIVVSRDGKSLYYHAYSNAQSDDVRFMKHDLISGEEKELFRNKYINGGTWLSRDGRYVGIVAIDNRPTGPARMMVIPTSGGPPREVISRPGLGAGNFLAGGLGAVNFSPDGRYIATGSVDETTKSRAIILIPVEGGDVKELMRVADLRPLVVAEWSPDSRSVLLKESSASWDQSILWRAPIDGSKPQRLDFNADHIAGGFLTSPDWKYVVFQTPPSARKPTEIWVTENVLSALNASE